jgi:zinc protease
MNAIKLLVTLIVITSVLGCKQNNLENTTDIVTQTKEDGNGFSYESVTNDPTGLRLYTLDNGLKVYLGKNEDEPKIQTLIAVRAGSTYDPKDNTGLAHYLEHMVFKGTDEIGTQNWQKEKQLISKISELYEQHKNEKDPLTKQAIYKDIDSVSQEASKYSIANEYDKMISSLGAENTNAFTSTEETVYISKIPSNEIDKWLKVESERFSQLVLRLFHTELEAVYEEFNRGQDSDGRKHYAAVLEGLFPNHPYGTQSTIGTSEHLKNPSMVAINNYFDTYYVPNNMAVIMVGDLDFEETIKKINSAFGTFKYKEVNHPTFPEQPEIGEPIEKVVYGPTTESVYVAFRTKGVGSKDEQIVTLIDYILANSAAGLIDLDLNQQQKVQRASSFTNFDNDYGMHILYGIPKAEQSLDEVKSLLLGELEKVKQGKFDEWLIDAVVNDLKKSRIQQYENNSATAYAYLDAFIGKQDWEKRLKFLNELKSITKQELVEFANSHYKNNYVVAFKKQGKDSTIVKVENPNITPIQVNRNKQSQFLTDFNTMDSPTLKPQFVDYSKAIKTQQTANGLDLQFVLNESNELFTLNIIFDMGSDHDKELSLAAGYLDFLGTDKYTPKELKKEFYKIGVDYSVYTQNDKTYISLSGLGENLEKGLELIQHLWDNAIPNQEAYDKYVESIAKNREDKKMEKRNILFNGLMNFGKYGEDSRLRDIYSIKELQNIKPSDLVQKVKDLQDFKHRIFYYGNDVETANSAISNQLQIADSLKEYPDPKDYNEKDTGGRVYFTNYDMTQTEIVFIAKGEEFDAKKMAATNLFNTYFGSGLSSIVFQDIRESKALAYSAFSSYQNASEKGEPNYVMAYIGTQANKMPEAVEAMMDLMSNMPEAKDQFQAAKEATLKKIAANRITKADIFWTYESIKKRGLSKDNRQEMYNAVLEMTLDDLSNFFEENIKGENYNILVIGNKNEINFEALSKYGEIIELDRDYLFNYEVPTPIKN